jgi:hypothetical protein
MRRKHIMKSMNKLQMSVLVAIIVGLLAGVAVAYAVNAVWSPLSQPLTPQAILPNQLSAPVWTGTTNVGSSIQLSTTLSPTPTNPQTVAFYYTYLSTASSSTPIGTDPATDLVAVGSPVQSVGNTATTQFTISTQQTYYFIAEDSAPS